MMQLMLSRPPFFDARGRQAGIDSLRTFFQLDAAFLLKILLKLSIVFENSHHGSHSFSIRNLNTFGKKT